MTAIYKYYSDTQVNNEISRNRNITDENVTATFGRPIFVYGTLLRDQPNYNRLLKGRTEKIVPAKLYGHSICAGPGFPYMAKVKSGTPVKGELVYLPEESYIELLRMLDGLEGAGSGFYNRVRVRVKTPNGDRIAWAYTSERRYVHSRRIESGSWIEYLGGK